MSAEQKARDMLARIGVELSQSFSAGDLVELANLIAERDELREQVKVLQQLIYGLKPECDLAMKNTLAARIPECGDFGVIAQSLSYVIQEVIAATEQKP